MTNNPTNITHHKVWLGSIHSFRAMFLFHWLPRILAIVVSGSCFKTYLSKTNP